MARGSVTVDLELPKKETHRETIPLDSAFDSGRNAVHRFDDDGKRIAAGGSNILRLRHGIE
jgi:hypothetical protein